MPAAPAGRAEEGFKRYICRYCGFIYSEAEGLPEHGIRPGTRWDHVPAEFLCPDCGNDKSSFLLHEE